MPFTHADVLAAARRSLVAAGAHDRDGWIGLFTADGRVEDPVGSAPHRGHPAIGRFYDTFIAPRSISFRPEGDIVVGTVVIRDVELEIEMSTSLTMTVPTFIRYDLRDESGEPKIASLSAYWELPAMIGQFARAGLRAVPAGLSLGRTMFANQGLGGSLGFLGGFRGLGGGVKGLFARFLDDVCGGDEVGMRRPLSDATLTLGDSDALTSSDLVKNLAGGGWSKLISAGRSVAARVDRDGQRMVLVAEIGARAGADRPRITRIRLFAEVN
ncbi:nuclear transport factor 2 family protein [Mycolicibacterium sp. BiH015]|uniref:nuclear transport factor 2 family protein n=1 Tax=Mycolicibacterium sp. BiH015 TaxID=3018808 RepID=UPI0022E4CC8D|nr:nuclear transport factor 2 family protein [Mycolicibacterium sp. BiH015]MDA2893557.1 nuclear transport factor 2 family protein [Mycolicibacterium sp. BiH015]